MPKKKKGKRGFGVGGSTTENESPTSVPLQIREKALKHLQDTFSSQVDPDVVYFILAECDYNVDAALENLLTLAAENAPASGSVPNDDFASEAVFRTLKVMNPRQLEPFEDDASANSYSRISTKEDIRCNPPCATTSLYASTQEIYVSNEDLYTGDGSLEKFKSTDQFVFGAHSLSLLDASLPNLEGTKEDSPDYSVCSSNTDLHSTSASCDNIDSFADNFDAMKISVSSRSDSSIEADASESVVTPSQENSMCVPAPPSCAEGSVTDVSFKCNHPDESYTQVSNPNQSAFRTIGTHKRPQISPFVQNAVTSETGIVNSNHSDSSYHSNAGECVQIPSFVVQYDTAAGYSVHPNSLHSCPSSKSIETPSLDKHMEELGPATHSSVSPNFSYPLHAGKSVNMQTSVLSNTGPPQFVPQWIVPTIPNHQQRRKTPTPTNMPPRPPFWCYSNGAQFKRDSTSLLEQSTNGADLTAASNCSSSEVCQKERIIHSINKGVKVLVLLRGLPGSGKSTLAQQLKRGGIIFSTDSYFIRKGQYSYDATKLSEAHEWNKHRACIALKEGRSPVIIDNTNTQSWEMKPYVLLGLQYGYHIEIVEPDTPWRFQPKILATKSTHNISKDKIKLMSERYERHVSIRSILASCNGKPLSKLKLPPPSVDVAINEAPSKHPPPKTLSHDQVPSQKELLGQPLTSKKEVSYQNFPIQKEVPCWELPSHKTENKTETGSHSSPLLRGAELVSDETVSQGEIEGTENQRLIVEPEKKTCDPVQVEESCRMDDECSTSSKSTKRTKHRKTNIVYPRLPDDYNVEDPNFWSGEANSAETPDEETMSSPNNNSVATSKRRNARRRHEQGNVTLPLSTDKPSTEISPHRNTNPNGWERRPSITLTDDDWKESHDTVLQSSPSTDEIFDILDVFDLPKPPRQIPDKVNGSLEYSQVSPDGMVGPQLPPKCQKHKSSRKKLAATFSQACCAECNWEIPQFPDTINPVIEDSPKNVSIATCSTSTETDNKYFQLAEDANVENDNIDGVLIRICRKRSICDRTCAPVKNSTIGPLKNDKGCMTDDSVCTANSDVLRSCFPDLPSEFVEDIFNKCAGNIEWAASILVEPNSKVLTTGRLITNATASDDVHGTERSERNIVLSVQEVQTSASNAEITDSIENSSTNEGEGTSQSEVLASASMELHQTLPEKGSDTRNQSLNFPQTSMIRNPTSSPEKNYSSNSSSEDPEEFSDNDSSKRGSCSNVSMRLDPMFAQQLEKLFGPVGFTESTDHKEDDFVFQIDIDLAWRIYESWTSGLRKKTEEEDLRFESTFCDESVAKRLQEEENAQFSQILTTPDHAISTTYSRVGVESQSTVPSLQEIMDLEMALQLSKDDIVKHRENRLSNGDMATRLKRQKMYEMFPKMDREALDEIFSAHNFSLLDTVQALQQQNSDEELISAVILADYEQQILDAVIRESRENAKTATPTAIIKPLDYPHHNQESGFEDFRSEATVHYRMRQECFAKAQTAYTSGMKAVASFYAQQGHLHGKKMWEANQRASRRILMHQNLGREKNTIDLHLLYVGEAIQLLAEYLSQKLEELQHCSDRKMIINVIVGRGRHSADKVPRLKLAVCDYLRRNDFRFTEKHAGLLQVKLT